MAMLIWIVVLVIAAIAEAVTTALVSIWFCIGAIAAAITAGLGAPVFFQLIVFVAVSVLALIVTKPLVNKLMPADKYIYTNGENDIGKRAVVVEAIDTENGTGRVKFGDIDWGARSVDGDPIKVGQIVEIVEKGAAFLKVRSVSEEELAADGDVGLLKRS
ncbi:MAG: NfeD family protein [Oscillospiraceae bacterium]|nr:NfeD family protein [Oscillospiraceae bacterium]